MSYTQYMSEADREMLESHFEWLDEQDLDTLCFIAENTDTQSDFESWVKDMTEESILGPSALTQAVEAVNRGKRVPTPLRDRLRERGIIN